MIMRIWHGRTRVSDGDRYAEFMRERAAPDYSSVDGLQKLYFLRKDKEKVSHFLLLTLWDSMDAVMKFAGDVPDKAKYYPEDDELLLEKEDEVDLYEMFMEQ